MNSAASKAAVSSPGTPQMLIKRMPITIIMNITVNTKRFLAWLSNRSALQFLAISTTALNQKNDINAHAPKFTIKVVVFNKGRALRSITESADNS